MSEALGHAADAKAVAEAEAARLRDQLDETADEVASTQRALQHAEEQVRFRSKVAPRGCLIFDNNTFFSRSKAGANDARCVRGWWGDNMKLGCGGGGEAAAHCAQPLVRHVAEAACSGPDQTGPRFAEAASWGFDG
jgi:hypothetical protein